MLIRCVQCVWFSDCRKAGLDESLLEDDVLSCPYYDGLAVITEGVRNKTPNPIKDYYPEDLGYDLVEVYVKGYGWLKCDPSKVKL